MRGEEGKRGWYTDPRSRPSVPRVGCQTEKTAWRNNWMALGRRGRREAAHPWSSLRLLTAVFSPLQSPLLLNVSASFWERKMTAQHPRSFSRSWMSFWPLMDKKWNGRRLQGGLVFLYLRNLMGNSSLCGNVHITGWLGKSTLKSLYGWNYLSWINQRIQGFDSIWIQNQV